MLNKRTKHIHCIGIGGIGVSALAELLLARGYVVSGSDIKASQNTERLQQLGIKIAIGHRAENVNGADHVIYSSAISRSNPEIIIAEQNKVPVLARGEVLAELVNSYSAIAIAGTHGKTTTTGLCAHILVQAGFDPSFAIGGIMMNQSSPVYVGKNKYFVVEVDESDASFLFMKPFYAVLTNIDTDHLGTYGGEFETLKKSFMDYVAKIPKEGAAVVCIDDPVIRELIPQMKSRLITYGFSEDAMIRASDFRQYGLVSEFTVNFSGKNTLPVKLIIPGRHNALNALAAITIANELGVPHDRIQDALATFPGMGRRFHVHGQMKTANGKALIIEDYGHHPREIQATLDAAKMTWPHKRIVLVFQPHRYTRTRDLYPEFIEVLRKAHKLYLMEIYGAGEEALENISSIRMVNEIAGETMTKPDYVMDLNALPKTLYDSLQDDDVVILQGAGTIGSMAKNLMQYDEK
jgi:UDP-N-acetylmuramate--alanine ligase